MKLLERTTGMSALTSTKTSGRSFKFGQIANSVVAAKASAIVETDIPARLDWLAWSGFHTRVIAALGITWILDGLEVTLAGALFGALIDTGSRNSVFAGYLLGSALMIAAAIIAWRYCFDAENKSLESIARPLAAQE